MTEHSSLTPLSKSPSPRVTMTNITLNIFLYHVVLIFPPRGKSQSPAAYNLPTMIIDE